MAFGAIGAGTAALTAGSSILGGLFGKKGSQAAAGADRAAAAAQLQMYQQTAGRLAPFVTGGVNALQQLPSLTPGTETQAQLEQTPGYQFALSQGLKSTQSANAARGLGVSGAALKGAASFATGLASNTYQNIFNQQQEVFKNALNIAQLGENAAANVGQQGTQAAGQFGQQTAAGGLATAAGLSGVGSSIAGAGGNLLNYSLLQNLIGQGGGTGGYGGTPQVNPGGTTPAGVVGYDPFGAVTRTV